MKPKQMCRLFALLLCCLFFFASCGQLPELLPGESQAEEEQPTAERRTVPFSQMEYTRPDIEALTGRLSELAGLISTAENFEQLWEYDQETGQLLEEFDTMQSLADLNRYLNINDPLYQEEHRFCSESEATVSNAGLLVNQAIVDSPYAEDYKAEVGDYVYQSILNGLRLNSPEVEELKKRASTLRADYNNDYSTLEIEYEGESYNMSDINQLEDSSLSYQLGALFNKTYYEHFSAMYLELLRVEKEIAATLGFSSGAEMYYVSFSRDYTPEDTLKFCQLIKEYIVPLVPNVLTSGYYAEPVSWDTAFNLMPGALEKIDDSLVDAYNYMEEYNLYDFTSHREKQSGIAFTTSLASYDAPYLYGFWENDLRSATTLYHEFGHFYDFWLHWDEDVVFNLDVAESYSQGLELLMQRFFSDLGDDRDIMTMDHMSDFMQALTYQPLLEEFQLRAWELEDPTAEELGQIYYDLYGEYGYGLFADKDTYYDWIRISHLFDAPFYTISYATSACVALQMWMRAQDNWNDGAELFLSMISAEQNQPFTQLVKTTGMRSPMSLTLIKEIRDVYIDTYGLERMPAVA